MDLRVLLLAPLVDAAGVIRADVSRDVLIDTRALFATGEAGSSSSRSSESMSYAARIEDHVRKTRLATSEMEKNFN